MSEESGSAAFTGSRPPLLSLPPEERQHIIVVDDAVLVAEQQARGRIDWWLLIKSASLFRLPRAFREARKLTKRVRNRGLQVTPVARTEASRLSFFPAGHPKRNVLYIANPVEPSDYYPAARFHRLTAEHKFSEAIDLLAALGAVDLEVAFDSDWGREIAAEVGVPIPTHVPAKAEVKAGRARQETTHYLWKHELDDPDRPPRLPDDLHWYPQESLWQQVAELRLERGLTKLELEVRYDDDFAVDASLAASAAHLGLKIGGKFQAQQDTRWHFSGTFAPRPKS